MGDEAPGSCSAESGAAKQSARFERGAVLRQLDQRCAPTGSNDLDETEPVDGGSLERLSTGVRLLHDHKGDRLLISGVNRIVTDQELFTALQIDPRLAACCVDLGRTAEDTLGNASETAVWARSHHYRELILVTDDYHMPRSYAELSLAMPEAEIHAYPVRTRWTDPKLWRSDLGAASRLGSEYVKYLVIRSTSGSKLKQRC